MLTATTMGDVHHGIRNEVNAELDDRDQTIAFLADCIQALAIGQGLSGDQFERLAALS